MQTPPANQAEQTPVTQGGGGKVNSSNAVTIVLIVVSVVLVLALVVFAIVYSSSSRANSQNPSGTTIVSTSGNATPSASTGSSTTTDSTSSTSSSSSSNPYLAYSADYIFPNSSTRLLSDSEIDGLNETTARIARNELAARHGRLFKDSDLQEYFNAKSWYHGSVDPDYFDANQSSYFNSYEKANSDKIAALETRRHYNGK
jgi:hypothetical protein